MKRKVGIYLDKKEHELLKNHVLNSGKTLTSYCKDKIFNKNEDLLKKHILRQYEDLLYLLISQLEIDTSKFNEDKLSQITSYAIHVGNIKAQNNKKLKKQRDIENSYKELFKVVSITKINDLILSVNQQSDTKRKNILLASYINEIKSALKGNDEKV